MPDQAVIDRLAVAGLIRDELGELRTTRRWQGAMARAAWRLYADGLPFDLRLPIVLALVEVFGSDMADSELTLLVEAMLPIEQRELAPVPDAQASAGRAP